MNANARIKGDVEFAGLHLVAVGGCGDGDDDVGELGLIGKDRRRREGGGGGDRRTGILHVGERTDCTVLGRAFRRGRRLRAWHGSGGIRCGGIGAVEGG